MRQQLSDRCRKLLAVQCGVIARWQATAVGLDANTIITRVRSGRWRRLGWGVYATYTGEPSRTAVLWAAVLGAGPRAILSHETAAELDGLAHGVSAPVHVTVPRQQHIDARREVAIHRSDRIQQTRHPSLTPPRTMIEETVLDLTQASGTFDDAFSWVSRACQRGLTTPTLLGMRMHMRKKMRWRAELSEAFPDVGSGAHSALEFRYLRDVERAHRLPHAKRQSRMAHDGRRQYRDVFYEQYAVVVELDGRLAHPAESRWHDIHRDNAAAADGIITLRYGWADVSQRTCQVAAEVAVVLQVRGWKGTPRPCRPNCMAGRLAS